MTTLGIDLGTSGVRAVSFDDAGRAVASASRTTPLLRPSAGRVVFDAEAMLARVEEAVTQVSAATTEPIRAVSFAGMGEAVVPVDAAGRATDLAPVGMDARGGPACARLGAELGPMRVRELTGQPLHRMFSVHLVAAGDLDWRPPVAVAYRTPADFVATRWGARPATDWGAAARTGLFEVETGRWSEPVLEAASRFAPWLHDIGFADPVPAGTVTGELSRELARRLGLRPGTLLVAGTHDQTAAFLGAGGEAGAVSVFSMGSSDCLSVGSAERPPGLTGTGFASYPWRPGHWVTLAGTAAGGWTVDWYARLTGSSDTSQVLSEVVPEPVDPPPPALVLPYLAGSGTLDNDPDSRGAVLGLTLGLTRPQLTRAFLESAGYELGAMAAAFVDVGLTVGEVRAVGTGATSAASLTLRARAAGLALIPGPGQATARGAALVAGSAAGLYSLDQPPTPDLGDPVSPDPTTRDWYAGQRRDYRELYAALRPVLARYCALATTPATTPATTTAAPSR